jgi:hypothetical protein
MFKATRELIKARQPFTKYLVKCVPVSRVGGGIANKCFDNACAITGQRNGDTVASGWLVGKYNSELLYTEIIQHFWNVDRNGRHFDTTPIGDMEFDYVIDSDLCEFGQKNIDSITSCVASSLLLRNGKFFAVDMLDSQPAARIINSLETNNLFQYEIESEYLLAA